MLEIIVKQERSNEADMRSASVPRAGKKIRFRSSVLPTRRPQAGHSKAPKPDFESRRNHPMKITLGNILMLVLITLGGVAGSVVVGLMLHGGSVFDTENVGFSFLAYGLSGGIIFAFYHVRGLSEAITAAVVVSAVQFAVSTGLITVLLAGIWSFGVNLPVIVLAFLFERKLATLKWARFLVVAIVYGAMFVLLSLLAAALTGVDEMPPAVFRENFLTGLLIGMGLGVGVQGGEAFMHSYQQHASTR